MKLSNLSIIFIIIMLPLSVVLSTYVQLQIDVLVEKENYSTKLLDATYDGILSFEINSLSIDNAEGQSVKTFVSNAVNTFFDTMSINLGASGGNKLNIQSYVPAILFTTYDGYYIYSPVKTPKVQIDSTTGIARDNDSTGTDGVDDGNHELIYDDGTADGKMATSENSGKVMYDVSSIGTKYNYMVKPFIYYSATYSNISGSNFSNKGDYNVVVNYSLDNHIALYGRYIDKNGDIRNVSKSGYILDLNNTKIDISGSNFYVKGSYDYGAPYGTDVDTNVNLKLGYDKLNDNDWVTLMECADANLQVVSGRI